MKNFIDSNLMFPKPIRKVIFRRHLFPCKDYFVVVATSIESAVDYPPDGKYRKKFRGAANPKPSRKDRKMKRERKQLSR